MTATASVAQDGGIRVPSPSPSVTSVASSRSGTLSRPPPPPKPSHLSCAFTGTVNSVALHQYIQAQKTGGSFTSDDRGGTISKAFAGYGYGGLDQFVATFESSDDEAEGKGPDKPAGAGTARPTTRNRTYTAPSVSRVFNPSAEDDAGDGTTKLIRKEPIQIDGKGPSRVGNLRSMFEAPAEATRLSPQRTGTTLSRAKARKVSEKTRMLQAQITGEGGAWNFVKPSEEVLHQIQASEADTVYATAKEEDFRRELGKLPLLDDGQEAAGTIRLSMVKKAESLVAAEVAACSVPSSVSASPAAHDRDDSSATIRPSTVSPKLGSSQRVPSSIRTPSSRGRSRLSSVFCASPTAMQSPHSVSGAPSPGSKSAAGSSEYAETDGGRRERSREPSMLMDHQNLKTSAHMRAHDGSSFDFDWVNKSHDEDAANVASQTSTPEKPAERQVEADRRQTRRSTSFRNSTLAPIAVRAGPPPQRPDSIILSLESQVEEAPVPQLDLMAEAGASSEHEQEQQQEQEQQDGPYIEDSRSTNAEAAGLPMPRLPQPGIGRQARALYDFLGEASFNELSLQAGQSFEILNEELAGGWSLGIVWDENGLPRRGLIPRGWYCYIQDFTMSPPAAHGIEPPPTPALFPDEEDGRGHPSTDNGFDVPLIRTSSPNTGAAAATATTAAFGGGEPMARFGSLGAGAGPTVGLSSAKANGGTWKQATTSTSQGGAQALEALLNLTADHRASPPSQGQHAESEDPLHTPQAETTSLDHGPQSSGEAEYSFDTVTLHVQQNVGPSADPSVHACSASTPARSQGTQSANAPKAETASASTVFGWRTSIFKGKTLNRFASFVTSGAEEYILSKDSDSIGSDRSRTTARLAPSFGSTSNMSDHTDATSFDGEAHAHARSREASGSSSGSAKPEDVDQHYIVAGRAGPQWKAKTPPFLVQVHSPEKRTKMSGMHEYTVFCVTSTFPALPVQGNADAVDRSSEPTGWEHGRDDTDASGDDDDADEDGAVRMPYDPIAAPEPPGPSLTVLRRFTQFAWLFQTLTKFFPALVIPPLPEKQYSGRFATEFIETRRADLELWIGRIVRHPVLRYSEAVLFFLSCDDDIEWKRQAGRLLRGEGRENSVTAGKGKLKANMFARTWHPSFNFDATEAAFEGEVVDAYLRAMEKTMNGVGGPNAGRQGVLGAWKGLREGAVSVSSCYRDLSYSVLRLITGAGVADDDAAVHGAGSAPGGRSGGGGAEYAHYFHGPPMGNLGKRSESGATNEHGAWCWREDCHDCTNLTYVLQNTAEALQDVADLYEDHARDSLLRHHERLKDISRPHTAHQALLETHRATLVKYREATGEPDPLDPTVDDALDAAPALSPQEAERIASRCETVVNVTLAEMDRVHDERVEDLHSIGKHFLDSQIEVYESILATLRNARAHYDEEYYDCERGTHILPSRYQADLSRPRRVERNLPMPSAALGGMGGLGKVGMLLSSAAGMTRPVSSGFGNAAADAAERADAANPLGGSFFLFPSHSPGISGSGSELRSGTLTATSTLKASQQAQQPGNRTSYFALWR
ncbi:hypothetical protein ACQY0O_007348 [Thecaphora frezii]